MKKIYNIGMMLLMMAMASCDLNQYPYSEVASDEYVKDDNSVNTLVIGCYNGLHDVLYNEWALTEVRSDNARCYDAKSTSDNSKLESQFDQGTIQTENSWMLSYWEASYATIERTNNVIENLDKVSSEQLKKQYEGEALFLRSLQYFNLVRQWGPVFIVTRKIDAKESRYMQRSPVDDVYALIEGDLERIIEEQLLPQTMSTNDIGRADLNAAKALLAKVYATHYKLGSEKFAKAADLCLEVLQSEQVGNPRSASDLVDYDKVFSIENEMSKEIIFSIRYKAGNYGLGSPFGNIFAPINNGGNVIIGKAYGMNTPSDNLIKAYPAGDKRKDVTLAERYYNKTTKQWVETGNNCRFCTKFLSDVSIEFDGESDWPVLRVGDIALLYAELSNEINGPSAEALTYLNMIHERAGLTAYTIDELSTKYNFRQAVRNERRLELAFENQRWFDLMRWGVAVQTINNYFNAEAFYSGYNYTVNPISEWQTVLPIPVSVLNINPDIAQNPGY